MISKIPKDKISLYINIFIKKIKIFKAERNSFEVLCSFAKA